MDIQKLFEQLSAALDSEAESAPPKLRREVRHVAQKVRACRTHYHINYLQRLPKPEKKAPQKDKE